MKRESVVVFPSELAAAVSPAGEQGATDWEKREMTKDSLTEGAAAGDLDGEGVMDLVAGALWFKGPDFSGAGARRAIGRPTG